MRTPCYGYQDRHADCHGSCERYAEYVRACEAQRKRRHLAQETSERNLRQHNKWLMKRKRLGR